MIMPLIGLVVIGCFLLYSEYLWRKRKVRGERARKFVHITVGTFIAFWPYFMSFRLIQLISVAMFVIILISRRYKIFKAIHTVKRKTWGELLYPIAIGLVATFAQVDWIFTAAILHLSLADGLAAIVGDRYGRKNSYLIFGQAKSLVGSVTFWVVSTMILGVMIALNSHNVSELAIPIVLLLPLVATCLENISVFGTDNITVTFVICGALNYLYYIY